jgi:hypothetical protein
LAVLALLTALCAACVEQQPAPAAPPPPPQQAAAPAQPEPPAYVGVLEGKHGQPLTGHDIRNTPPFSTSWRALLRRSGKIRETWLTRFDAPKTPVRLVRIGGEQYIRVDGCKAKSCAANSVVVLFCEKHKATYARLRQNGESQWLGDPPDEIVQAFEQLEQQDARK